MDIAAARETHQQKYEAATRAHWEATRAARAAYEEARAAYQAATAGADKILSDTLRAIDADYDAGTYEQEEGT